MTFKQIAWASKHDWFVSSDSGIVYVNDITYNADTKETTVKLVSFDNFSDLYEWAGY